MDKKKSLSQIVSGIHCIYRLILLSLFSAAFVFADSRQVVTDLEAYLDSRQVVKGLETYFSDLDSTLSTFGQEVSRYGSRRAKEPLEKMLQDYPGIEFLIWVNSKGVVVNEAVREGKPGKPHRNLSRQKWFKKIKNLEPYYSSFKTGKGDHQLFWCKPIRITKSGRDRSGGAIVAKIDLKRSFDTVAKKIGTPYRVLQKEQPLFSHSWKMSYDSTAVPLTIKGISDIQINVKKENPVLEATPPEPGKEEAFFFSPKLIIVFVSIVIALVVLLSIIKVVVKMRHEALIRRIEGDEPFIEPDKPFDEPREGELIYDDVKAAEAILLKKREEESLSETEVKMPPGEKSEVILEPEESTAKEGAGITQPEELSDTEEKKEVKSEIPSSREGPFVMDFIPLETQVLQPDFVDAIKAVKPGEGEEANETTVAAEEEPKTIPPIIMEKVEALLQKHLNSVLAERVKLIEEEVLARVRDELAGGMKDLEE